MKDFGIKISQDGKDVTNAPLTDLLLSSEYPFSKIDTQNPSGFKTVLLTFVNEVPSALSSLRFTKVHSFKHGYDYLPQYWAVANLLAPPPGGNYYDPYIADNSPGLINGYDVDNYVELFFRGTATTIDTYVVVVSDGTVPLTNLAIQGMTLNLGFYVFVDNI